MREITPSFFPDLEKHVEGQVLRKTTPFPVQSYHELVRKVAQLSFLNKDYLLFFRGQDQDYQNKAESSTFYPTIYRKEILTAQEIRARFELLEVATNKLLEAFDREKLDGRVDVRRKQYIAWSILQHYGVCDTPLLDLTQSLRVAATFAQLGNHAERGMVYVFGLPYTTNRITYNSEQDLVIVRLLSICPPEALRPYFQEGYLCGTLDITDSYTNKSELDFKNRLVAKFSIPTAASFWGSGFSRIPKNLLFPENDLIEAMCSRIREEIISDLTRYGPREALVAFEGHAATGRWTYDELWLRSLEVARSLVACGMGKGEHVGILMTNRLEWVSAMFGIAMAGGVGVGLSTFSTPEELEKLLRMSGVSTVLFERHVAAKDFAAMLRGLEPAIDAAAPGKLASARFPYLRRLVMVGEGQAGGAIESWGAFLAHGAGLDDGLVEARGAAVHPADPALLFFSSGSTGKPKGVLSMHRGVNIQLWRWVRIYNYQPDHPVRCWSPNGLFWSGNFSISLGGTLAAGGALILQRMFDPAESVRLFAAERVTMPYCWPHQWAQLEDAPGWDEADLSSFHYFEPAQNLRRPQRTVSTPWIEPHATYGATETFTISAAYPCGSPEDLWKGCNGGALPGNTIKIVDPETGRTLMRGETGEFAIKGPTLMLGYIGVPPEEALDAEGFYHAGDGGFIDERDRLVFQGRINDIIKTGGANVSPVEIDWNLCNCPGVKVCKTTGVPHGTLGEMVVSCVVRVEGSEVSEAEVIAFLKARLAAYKVPRKVLFIEQGDLDFTDTAKIKPAEARAFARRKLATMAE